MMQLSGTLKTENGDVTFTCEAENTSQLFTEYAAGSEVFLDPANLNCPLLDEVEQYSYNVRQMGETKHLAYEIVAQGWLNKRRAWARKSFGVKDDDTRNLFPHRKWPKNHSKEGEYIPNNGWKMYDKDAGEDVSPE